MMLSDGEAEHVIVISWKMIVPLAGNTQHRIGTLSGLAVADGPLCW